MRLLTQSPESRLSPLHSHNSLNDLDARAPPRLDTKPIPRAVALQFTEPPLRGQGGSPETMLVLDTVLSLTPFVTIDLYYYLATHRHETCDSCIVYCTAYSELCLL